MVADDQGRERKGGLAARRSIKLRHPDRVNADASDKNLEPALG